MSNAKDVPVTQSESLELMVGMVFLWMIPVIAFLLVIFAL